MKRNLLKIISLTLLVFILLPTLFACGEPGEPGQRVYYVELNIKDMGRIVLELDAKYAPVTVNNFVGLVKEGFYDGLTFHRVQPGFMIQGGDPDANGTGGSGTDIFGEFDSNGHNNPISHKRGVISMAREGGNNNSASSQFFICHADATFLDGDYAAFGYVVEGMEVVDKIVTETSPYANPSNSYAIADKTKHAVIESARVLRDYTPAS